MDLSRTRLVAGIAAAALPLAFLAGCGEDEPEPKFEEPTSESPSASESPTPDRPTKPTPPGAMKGDDVAGAKAFVKYYFATMDYALTTKRTGPLDSLATPSCTTCAGVVKVIDSIRRNDGKVSGGLHSVREVQLNELSSESVAGLFRGNVHVHTTAQTIRDSGMDGVDGEFPEGVRRYSIVVSRDNNGWKLTDWRSL